MSTVQEIEAALEKLSIEEQRQIAGWLDTRLARVARLAETEEAWSDELKRRIDELDGGCVAPVPAAQVFEQARKILGR